LAKFCHSIHWDALVPLSSAQWGSSIGIPRISGFVTDKRHWGEQGNDFSAILCAISNSCTAIRAHSPVEIEVIAPDGGVMSANYSSIPGASFMPVPSDDGEETVDTILIPFPLDGEYQVRLAAKPDATPTDTYTIDATKNGVTEVIAQDVQIADMPAEGYKTLVDTTAPTITINAPLASNYIFGQVVAASYGCADSGSSVAVCAGPVSNGASIDTSSVGPKTFTVNATDTVGNTRLFGQVCKRGRVPGIYRPPDPAARERRRDERIQEGQYRTGQVPSVRRER
jgi:hypothetical protein